MTTYQYSFDGVDYKTPNKLSDLEVKNLVQSYREAGLTHPTAVEQQRLAREDLINNAAIKDAFNKFYTRRNGQAFDGTDDELIDEYMEQMRYFDTNIGSISRLAGELQADYYTEEERQALGVMWGTWENVIPFTQQENGKWDAIWDFGEAAVTDPSNWLGLLSGGAATVGGIAAKQAAKAGVRKLIMTGLMEGGKQGVQQGALWGAAQSVARQSAQGQVGIGDGVDLGETVQDGAMGAAIGGAFGAGLGAITGAVKARPSSSKTAPLSEADTVVNANPNDTRATMDAASAAERFMEALADETVQGEARDAARQAFIESMGQAVQRQGAGVKKTNSQVLEEATIMLKNIGVKTFEPDEVVAKLFEAKNKNKLGMSQDQFVALANELENFTWNQFKDQWQKGNKDAATKLWDNFEKATTMAGGAATETGRALQLQRLRGRTDPMTFAEALDHIATRVDSPMEARLAAKKAAEKAGIWRRMGAGLNEYFINNILGSPVTLGINTISGYIHGWDRGLTAMAAGVKNANGKLIRQGAVQVVMQHYYIGQAIRYSLRAAAKGEALLDKGRNFTDEGAGNNIVIGDRNFDFMKPGSLIPQRGESLGMYGANIIGNVNRLIGGRGMVATDELVKQMNFRAKLFQLELDDALARGEGFGQALKTAQQNTAKKTEDYIDAVGMGIDTHDPKLKQSLEEAREVTFQTDFKDDFFGRLGKDTQSLVTQKYPILRQIMPFVRTPSNILSYVGEKTPGLQMTSAKFRERLSSQDPAVRQKAEMSLTLGTMLWAGGIMAASSGIVTGPGSPDYARRKVEGLSKEHLPYSIQVGDKQVSIRRYDPWAKFFLVMGGINDVYKYGKDEEQKAVFAKMALATAESIFAMPALSGLQSVVQTMNNPERGVDTFLGKQAQSFVPYYRLMQDVIEAQGQDKIIYETFGISQFAKDPALLFETKWPFLAEEKTIDVRRDPIFGTMQVAQPNLGVVVSGLAYKEGTDPRVIEELNRVGVGKTPPSPVQFGQVDMRKFPYKEGQQRTVYDLYQELVGRVKIGKENLYTALERTMNSDYYLQTLTDNSALVGRGEFTGSREKELTGVINEYRTEAMRALIQVLEKENPEHPFVQMYKQAPIVNDLNQTQQTKQMTPEILENMFGPLGNNQ